jgi:FKBP-type peptidyl-prolyl cis-trans isomerase SlyD
VNESLKVEDGLVVSMDYTLRVEGQIVDTSEGEQPIDFIQGSGNIIPGLESQLYGMGIGESKEVVVAAKDGYGEINEEAYSKIPRGQFPANIPLEEGIELQVRDNDGRSLYARIDNFNTEHVKLNFNHPLAGKELYFEASIAAIRPATNEELEHGHVHHGDDH